MRKLATSAFLLLLTIPAAAQQANNAVFLELGGNAIVGSINYERRLRPQWTGRAGLLVVQGRSTTSVGTTDDDTTFVIPLTASWLSNPSGNHHFEAGGGVTLAAGDRQDLYETISDDDEEFSTAFVTGIVGYRYQKPGRGFQFRVFGAPIAGGGELLLWTGISFGYAF